LLLLLLCLSRDLFRLKEVRELLERWVRLTGTGEEVLDAALRMLGVDPREPLYSAKASANANANANGGSAAAVGNGVNATTGAAAAAASSTANTDKAAGAVAGVEAAAAGQAAGGAPSFESDLGGLLDAAKTSPGAASSSGAGSAGVAGSNGGAASAPGAASSSSSGGVAAPPPRPLSSVILAPVSLGSWELKRASERSRAAARESDLRLHTLRELASSSNDAVRHSLGLTPVDNELRQRKRSKALMQRSRKAQAQQLQMQQMQQAQAAAAQQQQQHQQQQALQQALPQPSHASTTAPAPRSMPSKHQTGVSQSLAQQPAHDNMLFLSEQEQSNLTHGGRGALLLTSFEE